MTERALLHTPAPVSAENMPLWNRCGLTANNGSVVLTLAALDRLLTMAREAGRATLSEKLAAAENDAAAWKADAGETHLRLAAVEAERDEARAWSAGRATDIVTLGAALGAAEAKVEALKVELDAVRDAEGLATGSRRRWKSAGLALRAENKALKGALEPFADAACHLHPNQPDDGLTLDGIEVRHWRAAWAAWSDRSTGADE